MSDESCPVVEVVGEKGDMLRINQSDYDADPSAWTLWTERKGANKAPAPVVAPVAPAQPAAPADSAVPTAYLVDKEGKGAATRFFVCDSAGNKVSDLNGADGKGYATEAEAWAATMPKPA